MPNRAQAGGAFDVAARARELAADIKADQDDRQNS